MSFQVQDYQYTLNSDDLKDKSYFPFLLEFAENYYRCSDVFAERGENLAFGAGGKVMNVNLSDKEFDMDVSFKTVKSEGEIVGFLGAYIDLASGYVLFDIVKRSEYVPAFNLYQLIGNEYDIQVNPSLMKKIIERFKIGDLDLVEAFEEIPEATKLSGGSLVRRILKEEMSDRRDVIDEEYSSLIMLKRVLNTMRDATQTGYFDMFHEVVSWHSEIENDFPKLGVFIKTISLGVNYLYQINKLYTNIFNEFSGERYDPFYDKAFAEDDERIKRYLKEERNKFLWLSSMAHVDKVSTEAHYLEKSESFKNVTRTDAIAVNVVDLLEEAELDIDYLMATEDHSLIHDVLEKVGFRKYMEGMKLATISKGMRREEAQELIRDVNQTTSNFGERRTGRLFGFAGMDFVDQARYLGRLLDMAQKIINN